jgi:hypothetical protein
MRLLPLTSLLFIATVVSIAGAPAPPSGSLDGLLFLLTGEQGSTADLGAKGTMKPNFDYQVMRIADGARGGALSCGDLQRLAWWAPGNIQARRGTLSFYWRSRYPVGPTPFPIFRVGFADHSSWDMVFLRIDYNGRGFDAFVTDASLSRIRVSSTIGGFPDPKTWTHLAFAWDESIGVRLYIDGKLAASADKVAFLDAALDQFGPHSRIISPHNVQSDYNFVRGGDIDELCIHDRMLDAAAIAKLADPGNPSPKPSTIDLATRHSSQASAHDAAFLARHGWEDPTQAPPEIPACATVRKVEIHDAYDLKRWWWKACDGIRETTWPGVYNRSRLPGRNDYFQLPDWDCYSLSGKSITFQLPDEPCNQIEISGAAWGSLSVLPSGATDNKVPGTPLFARPAGHERTVHSLKTPLSGRRLRFDNIEQEQPIGELSAFHVSAGTEPQGSTKLSFRLSAAGPVPEDASLAPLRSYVAGRYPVEERTTLQARLASASHPRSPTGVRNIGEDGLASKRLLHLLVPNCWDNLEDGLDGLSLDLPAFKLKPTHAGLIAFNIQVHDPLWPMRSMMDFSFGLKPGEAHTLWLDLRDRMLPKGKGLLVSIACASPEFNPSVLEAAALRLVFKPRAAARAEHELDRFTQVRDCYAMLVEERPRSPQFNLYNRFAGDLEDLLRINPRHSPGMNYRAASDADAARPAYPLPSAPAGIPRWAFLQSEHLRRAQAFVNWWIDQRQIDNGEFGGGLSDDTDLTNLWPGLALMGCDPAKLRRSLHAELDACYRQGMFTQGLSSIQTDELHSYEEGINALGQILLLEHGNPLQLERAMETAKAIEGLASINAAGHRHIRSSYYSGTRMATEEPWGYAKAYSYLVLQAPQMLVDFNGSPRARATLLELADGLLAHRRMGADGRSYLPSAIRFVDDADASSTRNYFPWHLFWGAWSWTGQRRYLDPIMDHGAAALTLLNADALTQLSLRDTLGARLLAGDRGREADSTAKDGRGGGGARSNRYRVASPEHLLWQLSGDKIHLERLYLSQIEEMDLMQYINTEGSLWSDRVGVPTMDLQRARLGGIALARNALYPGHLVSWNFKAPAVPASLAILMPSAAPDAFKILAYNLETTPVDASLTGWGINPGTWEITQGIDETGDDSADTSLHTRSARFERSSSLEFRFPPRSTTVIEGRLTVPGKPLWQRPDLGIGGEDVQVHGRELRVRVHSLGAVAAPATRIVLHNPAGQIVSMETIPALPAPDELMPMTTDVCFSLPEGQQAAGCTLEIDPEAALEEITRDNNQLRLP